MKNKTVYLIRGHSGSGKSTLAQKLVLGGGVHLENDQFLLDEDGVYKWTRERHQRAKDKCLTAYENALARGVERIAVSNVFADLG